MPKTVAHGFVKSTNPGLNDIMERIDPLQPGEELHIPNPKVPVGSVMVLPEEKSELFEIERMSRNMNYADWIYDSLFCIGSTAVAC